jgi:hypothetical protein
MKTKTAKRTEFGTFSSRHLRHPFFCFSSYIHLLFHFLLSLVLRFHLYSSPTSETLKPSQLFFCFRRFLIEYNDTAPASSCISSFTTAQPTPVCCYGNCFASRNFGSAIPSAFAAYAAGQEVFGSSLGALAITPTAEDYWTMLQAASENNMTNNYWIGGDWLSGQGEFQHPLYNFLFTYAHHRFFFFFLFTSLSHSHSHSHSHSLSLSLALTLPFSSLFRFLPFLTFERFRFHLEWNRSLLLCHKRLH